MDVENMRDAIANVYGPDALNWIIKCKQMPENQVMAIYFTMEKSGKFEKKNHIKTLPDNFEYYQMTIWDYDWDL